MQYMMFDQHFLELVLFDNGDKKCHLLYLSLFLFHKVCKTFVGSGLCISHPHMQYMMFGLPLLACFLPRKPRIYPLDLGTRLDTLCKQGLPHTDL